MAIGVVRRPMATTEEFSRREDSPPFAGHSPARERPLGGYFALIGTFLGLAGAFSAWLRRSDRRLPERIAAADLLVCPHCLGMWSPPA